MTLLMPARANACGGRATVPCGTCMCEPCGECGECDGRGACGAVAAASAPAALCASAQGDAVIRRGVAGACAASAAPTAAPASSAPTDTAMPAKRAKPAGIPPGASVAYNAPAALDAHAAAPDARPAGPDAHPAGPEAHPAGPDAHPAGPEAHPAGPEAHPATLDAQPGTEALRRAVEVCGGQSALASAIGLTQSHVWNWLHRRGVPAEHCPAIERATGRAVRCEALRPDVDWGYLRAVCAEQEGAAPAAAGRAD